MKYNQASKKLTLTPIKNGWAAHAHTREEAIQKFLEAEQRHREIDNLPFWYERFRMQMPNRDRHE